MSDSLNLADFEQRVLQQPGPVVVDFSAPWCAPCRSLERALTELQPKLPDLPVLHVDTGAHPELGQRYNVRSVPTLVVFRDGRPVKASVGFAGAAKLETFLREAAG